MKRGKILDFGHARKYFLKSGNYFTVPLPKYFDFDVVLREAAEKINGRELFDCCDFEKLLTAEGVNYKLATSKDGKYAWREFMMIHPVLYLELVKTVTEPKNWELIYNKMRLFGEQSEVIVVSPLPGDEDEKNPAASSILKWWRGIEQESIKMSLYYSNMAETDILECYNSMNPRLVALALDGPRAENGVGHRIAWLISKTMDGETDGMPQGSALTDYLAEIVLSYVDVVFSNRLKEELPKVDYTIYRYRDDYRIFTKDEVTARKILKLLSVVLARFGFKLNPAKTVVYDDIIDAARKKDKGHFEMSVCEMKNAGIQKVLLSICDMSRKFPNSGGVLRAMIELYENKIVKLEHRPADAYQIMALTGDIMVRSPRTCQVGVAILCKIMSFNPGISRKSLARKIMAKAGVMPNTDYFEAWVQRITMKNRPGEKYKGQLCRASYEVGAKIWNSEWLDFDLCDAKVIRKAVVREMDYIMPVEEVQSFYGYHDGGMLDEEFREMG